MRTLVFATNNKHKLHEVREMLDGVVEIKSLDEMGLAGDIPETADTLQGNALLKAQWVWQRTHLDCFAEMPLEVKNQISHRGLAVAKLVAYLKGKKSKTK